MNLFFSSLCYRAQHTQYGFTLLELLLTLTISVIIITLATPYILKALISNDSNVTKNRIMSTMKLGKSSSYAQHQKLLLCLADESDSCHRDADYSIVLFADNNKNNRYDKNIDTIISKENLNLKYAKVKLRAGARRSYIRFSADSGTTRGHFGHISYCPTNEQNKHMFQISFDMVANIRYKPKGKFPMDC